MENARNEDLKKFIKKKKKSKLITLDQKDHKIAELEYEKYYNRIRLLSRGSH